MGGTLPQCLVYTVFNVQNINMTWLTARFSHASNVAYFKVRQFCVQPKGFNAKLESVRKQIDLDTNTSIRKYINRTQKLRLIMCDKLYSIIQWLSFCICHRPNLYLSQNRIVFVTEQISICHKNNNCIRDRTDMSGTAEKTVRDEVCLQGKLG